MTNYDRIKAMSIEEMANFMLFYCSTVFKHPKYTGLSGSYTDTAEQAIQMNTEWLQQEATE